jgi:UDP-glucose 4-epimerase
VNVLVTGGAGYVGSIVTEELVKRGHSVVVLDNLQQGHEQAVSRGVKLVVADIRQNKALDAIFRQSRVDAVMHMAAETLVEYSMTDPKRYFQNNIAASMNLLDTMLKFDVHKFIFSSSAAVYGEPQSVPIEEDHRKRPLNAYGESKLMFERILEWYGRAYGLRHISLRYFNAAGASENLGEDHRPETHLIPNVLQRALDESSPVAIFGTDYPTKDGSCIRDYIHVIDIAQAHLLALGKVEELSGRAYNLGNGAGFSVLETVAAAKRITKKDIPTRISPRRAGDPAVLVASSERAKAELGWQPHFADLDAIIESAWQWLKKHPKGYS